MYMMYDPRTSYKGRSLYELLRPYDVMALFEVYTACVEHLLRPEILDHLCSTLGTSKSSEKPEANLCANIFACHVKIKKTAPYYPDRKPSQ